MENIWQNMYDKAVKCNIAREVSTSVYAGSVSACVHTKKNNLYTGISIDTACSIGMCAERNALGTMLTNGESSFDKVVAVKNGQIIPPCGVCRELMMQLRQHNEVEILVSLNPLITYKLNCLMPHYWN
ncbi:cytidine deaminase family protein [Apilactobacillus xinyiensis]|uniref:cytidine deaminase family protein n=1 Tax=Apilactobacillus xinyiensis TaxID=2841032 RepID=UPI001C7D1D61|nr:cytidine deaminase [Apilactobacillus xinyiensis]